MQHVHAKLIMQYAKDAMETETPWKFWRRKLAGSWRKFDYCSPVWNPNVEYRRIGEFEELKKLQSSGAVIECFQDGNGSGFIGKWKTAKELNLKAFLFSEDIEYYRVRDEHRELREAQDRGEVIEMECGGEWLPGPWKFEHPVEFYRIQRPAVYLWAYSFEDNWNIEDEYYATEEEFLAGFASEFRPREFKRLDYTKLYI